MSMTLEKLIERYKHHDESSYRNLSYSVRVRYDRLLARLVNEHGSQTLADIKYRDLRRWHASWSLGGRFAMAHALIARLRVVSVFGFLWLDDDHCRRFMTLLEKFPQNNKIPSERRISAEQAEAFRLKAHEFGWHSLALAQAMQFELKLRQKDVIGEWVPLAEQGESDIRFRGQKWMSGIRWEQVDDDLVLTHGTSNRLQSNRIDLISKPMIVEELAFQGGRKASGPIVINEITGAPWSAAEFRRKWRIVANDAGIPKSLKNMDSSGSKVLADTAMQKRWTAISQLSD